MVYIQSDSDRKLPHHFDAACALYGAKDEGMECRLTSFEEVQSGKFNSLIKTNVFVGSTEFMREVFSKVQRNPQLPNSNRPHRKMTLGEVRAYIAQSTTGNFFSLFIKPFTIKEFTGFVADPYSISSMRSFPDTLEVMVYDVIPNIYSEWRLYIYRNKIVDSRNYSGDFKITPNYDAIEEGLIYTGDTMPIAYTFDAGVVDEKISKSKVVCIEYNDMWAIGNYGIDNDKYFNMLRQRYFEIIRGGVYAGAE